MIARSVCFAFSFAELPELARISALIYGNRDRSSRCYRNEPPLLRKTRVSRRARQLRSRDRRGSRTGRGGGSYLFHPDHSSSKTDSGRDNDFRACACARHAHPIERA